MGSCRGKSVDTGIDGIWLVDGKHPEPGLLIGYRQRDGSQVAMIHNNLPKAVLAEAITTATAGFEDTAAVMIAPGIQDVEPNEHDD